MRVNVKHRTAKGALLAARALIEDEQRWIKGGHAARCSSTVTDGHVIDSPAVDSTDPDAVCWCLDGAIIRALVGPNGRRDHDRGLLDMLYRQPLYTEICDVLRGAVEDVRDEAVRAGLKGDWPDLYDRATHVAFNDHRNTMHIHVLKVLDTAIAEA